MVLQPRGAKSGRLVIQETWVSWVQFTARRVLFHTCGIFETLGIVAPATEYVPLSDALGRRLGQLGCYVERDRVWMGKLEYNEVCPLNRFPVLFFHFSRSNF